jgi:hypothetical protein
MKWKGVYELVVQDKVVAMKPKVVIGAIQDGDAEG